MLVSGTKYEHKWAKTADDKVWEVNDVKLLVVEADLGLLQHPRWSAL